MKIFNLDGEDITIDNEENTIEVFHWAYERCFQYRFKAIISPFKIISADIGRLARPSKSRYSIQSRVDLCSKMDRTIKPYKNVDRKRLSEFHCNITTTTPDKIFIEYNDGLLGNNYTGAEDYIIEKGKVLYCIKNDHRHMGVKIAPDMEQLREMLEHIKKEG